MKKLLIISLSVFLFLSCAVNSGVIPLNDNEFFISKQAGVGEMNNNLKAEAILEGQSFCTGLNKKFKLLPSNQVQATPYYTEIKFSCN